MMSPHFYDVTLYSGYPWRHSLYSTVHDVTRGAKITPPLYDLTSGAKLLWRHSLFRLPMTSLPLVHCPWRHARRQNYTPTLWRHFRCQSGVVILLFLTFRNTLSIFLFEIGTKSSSALLRHHNKRTIIRYPKLFPVVCPLAIKNETLLQ